MLKLLSTYLAAFALAVGLAAPSGASAQTPEQLRAKGKIVVGVMVDFPPYGMLSSKGEPEGFDIDVAKMLGTKLGIPVELVPVSGPNRIPFLLTNKVDMLVASLGITPERAAQVDFSKPYERLNLWLYARKDLPIKSYEDLKGRTLAVARGNTADIALSKNAPRGVNILRFDDDASTRQALRSQQVDGSSGSDFSISVTDKELPGVYERKFSLTSQVQGVGFRKGQDAFVKLVNEAIEKSKQDGSLNAIRLKWIGQPLLDLSN
mgnify:CR=1 FL=1